MIVSIRLSIPDKEIEEVLYHAKRLKEMAKPYFPGVIDIKFPGEQGTSKTNGKGHGKRSELQKVGELFN